MERLQDHRGQTREPKSQWGYKDSIVVNLIQQVPEATVWALRDFDIEGYKRDLETASEMYCLVKEAK